MAAGRGLGACFQGVPSTPVPPGRPDLVRPRAPSHSRFKCLPAFLPASIFFLVMKLYNRVLPGNQKRSVYQQFKTASPSEGVTVRQAHSGMYVLIRSDASLLCAEGQPRQRHLLSTS